VEYSPPPAQHSVVGSLTIFLRTDPFNPKEPQYQRVGMGSLILVMGNVGERVGDHMRRGTLLLWNLPASGQLQRLRRSYARIFADAVCFVQKPELAFYRCGVGFNRVQRYAGDMAEMGWVG
jgi:hypothetical protein